MTINIMYYVYGSNKCPNFRALFPVLYLYLKGWFTKNASWVHMKEFSELIRMVYATYSNSSPIVRNLKIKNQR